MKFIKIRVIINSKININKHNRQKIMIIKKRKIIILAKKLNSLMLDCRGGWCDWCLVSGVAPHLSERGRRGRRRDWSSESRRGSGARASHRSASEAHTHSQSQPPGHEASHAVSASWSRFYESSQAMPTYRSYFD